MVGAVRAVEAVAICVNAHAGVQLYTRRAMQEAERAGDARILIVTKLDDDQADFGYLLAEFRRLWGPGVVPWNVPLGIGTSLRGVANVLSPPQQLQDAAYDLQTAARELIEAAVETDESLMERYLDGEMPSEDELHQAIPRAVASGRLIPVFCTSAKKQIGLQELLDGMVYCVPHPGMLSRTALGNGSAYSIHGDGDAPVVAQVFKNRIDPYVQKLSYIRVFSGKLTKDQVLHSSDSRKPIKLGPLLRVQGSQVEPITEAGPGEIVAIAKMEELHTGTCLGDVPLPPIPFPKPMVGLALCPKSHADENRLSAALHKIVEEDPTVRLDRDPQTSELVISGMSELHLQIIRERLARRDRLQIETHDPKIPFRETIQSFAEGMYRHRKQSGGRGQFGEVHIRMYPLPQGTDPQQFCTKERFPSMKQFHYDPDLHFLWVDSVVGGSIPGNFMPAIEKGFKERMQRGVLAGFQIQNVCVEVYFGKHHPVDSSEAAFKIAGSRCFKEVFAQAHPCLLEPIVQLRVVAPNDHVGDVYGDMSSRGGRVIGSENSAGDLQTIICEAPLRSVAHYGRSLSGITGGRGTFELEFARYEMVPTLVQRDIIKHAQLHPEEEE